MPVTTAKVKRTLRQLRHLEMTLRFGQAVPRDSVPLVWDVYFSTKDAHAASVKYSLASLQGMERDAFKAVIDEYFSRLFTETTQDQGFTPAAVYSPELLARLGLPPAAGRAEIKQRFRALAKQYHPDHGGDSEQFVALVAIYERLREELS